MKGSPIAWLYFFMGLMNLLAHLISSEHLIHWTKPLLMPLLIAYVLVETNERLNRSFWILLIALFFSWLGDVSLMLSALSISFLLGLGAFLIAHICYIFTFLKSVNEPVRFKNSIFLPLVAYGTVFLFYLLPRAGSLQIPILIYAIILLGMAGTAWLRQEKTNDESYIFTLSGAALFVISDSILAVDRFAVALPYNHFFVMLTYIPAQYLIVKGILAHYNQST